MHSLGKVAGCVVLVLVPLNVSAALQNSVSLTITPTDTSSGTGPFNQTLNGTGALAIPSTTATGGLSSSGTGSSLVVYGGIHLVGTTAGSIDLVATGIYRDTFTINALDPNTDTPIPAGTPGTFTFNVMVDGSVFASMGNSTSSWDVQAAVGDFALATIASGGTGSPESPSGGDFGDPLLFDYSRTVGFEFGMPTTLDIELTATASSRLDSGNEPGDAAFDLSPWVFWNGIDPIRIGTDDVENPVLVSDSGTDWIEPFNPPGDVPEPGTLGALVVGGILLAGRGRRDARLRRP